MKTIEQIALEVANSIAYEPDHTETYISFNKQQLVCFAKAFLAAVDAERGEPVATKLETPQFQSFRVSLEDAKRLEALPTGTKLYLAPQPIKQKDTGDLQDLVSKALNRAWQLGKTYWQQVDSEYQSQWKKGEATQEKFNLLVEETRAAIDEAMEES